MLFSGTNLSGNGNHPWADLSGIKYYLNATLQIGNTSSFWMAGIFYHTASRQFEPDTVLTDRPVARLSDCAPNKIR